MKSCLLLLLPLLASAATWDGTHDDLTVFTVELNSAVFGLAGVQSTLPAHSAEIFVSSTDKTVTAFRVAIEYRDDKGSHAETRTVAVGDFMALAFFGGVDVAQVSSVNITRLRDGAATSVK